MTIPRKVHYRGQTLTLNTLRFDNTLPSVVIRSYQGEYLMLNVDGMQSDWVMKRSMRDKMRSLAVDWGQVLFLLPSMQNAHQPQVREITRNGAVFIETAFQTRDELMVAFVPKDLRRVDPTRNPTPAVSWEWDHSHPYLTGVLLGRQYTYAKTTAGFAMMQGPRLSIGV